ncbi:transglycosylase domain-containing protein [Chthoniobacter flavus]|uniref:transglycosylase domain-containing protein n=1 Tax=Chthoniobacter flavus TaxID=191863 RepID=UPI0003094C9F|nr:transglycosylase domain-containing protein [Chthoniobacter flavus]
MFTLLAALIVVGGIFVAIERDQWQKRAAAFDYKKLEDMESASIIFDRNGQVLGRIFIQNRDQVAADQLSPWLYKSVVAAEDIRYYQHNGVDYYGIVRAAVRNYQAGRTRQGASTLTQQLARNSFPIELPSEDRSYKRKLLEIFVAQEIERRFSKPKILELYLNRVFFGDGFYGAESAARGYFGKHAKDVNLSEAAMLAGLLKSPNRLSPWRNHKACMEQRNFVLGRMLELQQISREEYDATISQDLVVKNRRSIHQESYPMDLVAQQVIGQFGRDAAISDGYRIYTTIDGDLQRKAEKALKEQLDVVERHEGYDHQRFGKYDIDFRAHQRMASNEVEGNTLPPPAYLQGSIVVLDNATGGILTLVGGRDFGHSSYNRALAARRPAGTAFKPFVYAAAFERGFGPGTIVQDTVIDNRQVMIGGVTGILGEWGPERVDNKYEGSISAREALVKSKNAATVRLGMMTGLDHVIPLAKAAGIESPLRPFPATFLGSSEVTLMEMTLANTAFPDGGTRPDKAFIIQKIEDQAGNVVFEAKPSKVRVMKDTTAYEIHTCLSDVLERGTADKAYTELGLKKFPLGGKTGTAYNFTDAWFLGYSSAVTCGVWAGFDKPSTIYRGAFSNEIALPIWAEVMKSTFANYRPKEIPQPKGIIKVELCSVSGQLATDKCFETVENKETGEKVQKRTTFFEISTEDQAPKVGCEVHNGGANRSFVKVIPGEEWPRAALAVDVSAVPIVAMKQPTVIGVDPYNSIQSVNNAKAMSSLEGQTAPVNSSAIVTPAPDNGTGPEQMEVRRAEPVQPMREQTVLDTTIKPPPLPPLDF